MNEKQDEQNSEEAEKHSSFDEDEYVQFARERMQMRMLQWRKRSRSRSIRSLSFTVIVVILLIILFNLFSANEPPAPQNTSPSTVTGGKKFVPLDTFHIAPNVVVSPSDK